MSGRYTQFDCSRVRCRPLSERVNDLQPGFILPLKERPTLDLGPKARERLALAAQAIHRAKNSGANTLLMLGGHVLRSGVQRYLFDLMERGFVQGIAVNGAVAIHDFETALQYATTESVARYISEGQFGLWQETGRINEIVRQGCMEGLGFGEALGRELTEGKYPHKDFSLFAFAWKLDIPITVHVGIGYDIIHAHPNCDGAALGQASYRDFLVFTQLLNNLENGVLADFGSAVMAPEVFLKALSMVRNVAKQEGREVRHFTTLVCDLLDIPDHSMAEAPKSDPRYYFRPWKTLLSRTVADGGQSYYVQGRHEETIPTLWSLLRKAVKEDLVCP